LLALLNNYSLQLVEDIKTHIYRVTIKDPAAPDPLVTKIYQLAYANPSNIVTTVQTALTDRRSKVVGDIRTSQLVVVATEKELTEVDTMVKRLDTSPRQVLIEARLLETSMSPNTTKGIDWSGTLQAQHLAFGNNLQVNSPADSVNNTLSQTLPKMLFDTAKGFNPATAFLDADGVAAVFSFLNKNAEAKVISAPRTVTLDNESAKIEVTRASPIINVTPGTVQVSGGSQITYTNLGIILNVTPRISANNYVNLKVVPEVSRIFDTITRSVGTLGVFQADEYDMRKMETRVMIPSGNTLVLGGLVQDDVRNSNTKVPVLGDLPLVGAVFRSDTKSRQKSNLIIFITPTIVEDADFQPTKSDFLKIPAPSSDTLDKDWSAWDSGKPLDWSKPAYDKDNSASK
jgi:general secretion pathway protein D